MPKLKQIDLPHELRGQFPESLGTLKLIQVLWKYEYAKVLEGKAKEEKAKDKEFKKQSSQNNIELSERLLKELAPGLFQNDCQKQETKSEGERDSDFNYDEGIIKKESCVFFMSWDYDWHSRKCTKFLKIPSPNDCEICENYLDYYDVKLKRARCGFCRKDYTNYPGQRFCIVNFLENPPLSACAECNAFFERHAEIPIFISIKPIYTGDMIIPLVWDVALQRKKDHVG